MFCQRISQFYMTYVLNKFHICPNRYDTEGPIDMPNIPPSWLPYWKNGINKRGRIRRRGWKILGARYERSKKKHISGKRKSYSDSKKGARLYGSLHNRDKTKVVQCQSETSIPLVTSTTTFWTSHRGISATQSTSKLGVQAQKPKVIGNEPP